MPRDKNVEETRAAWFKAGYLLARDNERGANEGLDPRTIRALDEENTVAFGLKSADSTVAWRCDQAGYDTVFDGEAKRIRDGRTARGER
jgi:hypothetical protein